MVFQAVILDVDGTLVISNDAHALAWVEAFATYGYEIQYEQVRPLIGMGGDQLIPRVVPELNGEEGKGKAIADKRKELMIKKFARTLTAAPGARELVLKMQQSDLQLIIATSATSEELSLLLKAAKVDDLLKESTTSSDAEHSKPEPDIVESALKKLNMEADRVVMIADTPYDIEAASKAGVAVIAVRCGGFDDSQLKDAIAIYNDPADLLENYNQSPLA